MLNLNIQFESHNFCERSNGCMNESLKENWIYLRIHLEKLFLPNSREKTQEYLFDKLNFYFSLKAANSGIHRTR